MAIKKLFATPIWSEKINFKEIQKDKLIKDILSNYKKDKYRNKWDSFDQNGTPSITHLSYRDDCNTNFINIDYKKYGLQKAIGKKIKKFIKTLPLKGDIKYEWGVSTYHVTTKNQFMYSHHHLPTDFTSVFFIKYNKKIHAPLTLYAPYGDIGLYIGMIRPALFNNANLDYLKGHEDIYPEEGEYVIFPSHILHSVKALNKTNEPRITISANIKIDSVNKNYYK